MNEILYHYTKKIMRRSSADNRNEVRNGHHKYGSSDIIIGGSDILLPGHDNQISAIGIMSSRTSSTIDKELLDFLGDKPTDIVRNPGDMINIHHGSTHQGKRGGNSESSSQSCSSYEYDELMDNCPHGGNSTEDSGGTMDSDDELYITDQSDESGDSIHGGGDEYNIRDALLSAASIVGSSEYEYDINGSLISGESN